MALVAGRNAADSKAWLKPVAEQQRSDEVGRSAVVLQGSLAVLTLHCDPTVRLFLCAVADGC